LAGQSLWVGLGALGTAASAGVLIWYTMLTSRLVKLTKAANEPFLTLTYDPNVRTLFLRNLGASPALDIIVSVEDARPGLGPLKLLKATYQRPAVSTHGDTRLQKGLESSVLDGRRFRIRYRDKGGTRHELPAPLVGDASNPEFFKWEFRDE
jgi:hypothetical protein